jgi:hypothetical protein
MLLIKPMVRPRPTNIPFLYYKEHSQDTLERLPLEMVNHEWMGLRKRVVIDRRWTQRLQDAWSDENSIEYIESVYRGYNQVDSFVLVSLKEIKRILEMVVDSIDDGNDKSTFDEFLSDVNKYLADNKEYLMINGQHRDEVYHRMWDSKLPLPHIFQGMDEDTRWSDLNLDEQFEALMKLQHPITIYDKLESLDDIEKIIILHNEGSEWNSHEKRSIKASYIMSELRKLDDYKPAQQLFDLLGTKNTSYDRKKKGISFLATQLYYQYRYKDKYHTILGINHSTLDKIVEWESEDWTKTSVDNFIKFFKKVIRELNLYFVGLPKNEDKVIRHKIATLRNYFMFRNIMTGRTNHHDSEEVFTITNEKNFVTWYVKRETQRLLLRNNLTNEGVKMYDMCMKRPSGITKKQIADLYNRFPKSNAYRLLLNGVSVDGQGKIAEIMWSDFSEEYNSDNLHHAVQVRGKDVSPLMKTEVRRLAVANSDSFDLEDIFALQDKDKTDIGHKDVPKSKGGSNTLENLFVQDSSWNRSEQDNH